MSDSAEEHARDPTPLIVEPNEDSGEVPPPLPPDGGWGWAVVIGSLFINLIVDGVTFSFGVFYITFLEHFGESKGKTAWVGSLIPGMYLGMGPIASALANKFGCRVVTIAGGIVAAVAFTLSTYSPNIDVLIVTYGVMGGIGFGLTYLPSIVIVGFYFDKRRALATGIAVCGSGIGTFIFAPLFQYLLDEYGWRGANWIIAAIILHIVFFGALYRPLEAPRSRPKTSETPVHGTIMQKIIDDKNRQRTISTGSMDGMLITRDNKFVKDAALAARNAVAKRKAQIALNGTSVRQQDDTVTCSNGAIVETGRRASNSADVTESQTMIVNKRLLELKYGERIRTASMLSTNSCFVGGGGSGGGVGDISDDREATAAAETDSFTRPHSRGSLSRRREPARPLYRQDIFYTGSVTSIAEFKSTPSMTSYVKSYTSMPTLRADSRVGRLQCGARCMPVFYVLKQMFDFSLLRSVTFLTLCVSSILAMTGFFTPFVYLTDKAILLGIQPSRATLLLSVLGICNTLGRIAAGWISDRPWADCLLIHNLSLVIAGVATCLVPLLTSFVQLCIFCVVFGLCIAAFIALRSIVLVELLGLQRLTNAFGLMLLFQGIASLIGSPLAGTIFDLTGSYAYSFVVAGSSVCIAGLMILPIRHINRMEQTWRSKTKKSTSGYMEVNIPPSPNDETRL